MKHTLRELRRAKGWTQAQLGRAAGIDRKRISKFETGVLGPTPEELKRLCAALGCAPSLLIVTSARTAGGQKTANRALLERFRVPPGPLPAPECTSAARLGSLWREQAGYMQSISSKLQGWSEFLDTAPSECLGETLIQLRELQLGAGFTFVTLDWLGYDRWPSVDGKTGRATGHCLRPALITRDWIMVFQVTVQTPRQKYRMDALVLVLEPQRTFVNVEHDGPGHDSSRDRMRTETLGLTTIRIRDEEILTGPSLTERLRRIGLCQKPGIKTRAA